MPACAARVVISLFDDVGNRRYGGGGPAVVSRIAERLAQDYEVVVVTAGDRYQISSRHGARYVHLPLTWAGPRLAQLLWAMVLPIVVLAVRHDVWIESFTPPFSSNMVPMFTRRPVIGLAQALSGREMARKYGTNLPLRVERRLLPRYRDIIVLNRLDREIVERCAPGTQVHVIPNAVPAPTRPVTDPTYGTYALFLGRIEVTQKGLDLLLEAYRLDHVGLPPLVLAGGGRPGDQDALVSLVRGCDDGVHWVGPVHGKEKEDLLDGCAFVIVPSREESFSLVALEALVRGRPVVRFDLPQLSWIPEGCGPVVPCFDVVELRAAIRHLWADPQARRAAGQRGAVAATRLVGPETADAYATLVAEVLRPRPDPTA